MRCFDLRLLLQDNGKGPLLMCEEVMAALRKHYAVDDFFGEISYDEAKPYTIVTRITRDQLKDITDAQSPQAP